MIPKIIHYCWFGEKPIPERLRKCMKSWQEIMPDYILMRWDESKFDINSLKFTQKAYQQGKYAFVSDYVRLYALEKYGGIYFDTDVEVLQTFDSLLKYDGILGFESDRIASAVMGFPPHHPVVKEFLSHYENLDFDTDKRGESEANVIMMTQILQNHGLIIEDKEQNVEGIHIFPREVFCPLDFYHNMNLTSESMTIHYFDASWLEAKHRAEIKWNRTETYKNYTKVKQVLSKVKRKLYRIITEMSRFRYNDKDN